MIVTLVCLLSEKDSKEPILCCANSNKATDHLALQFMKELGKDKVTRIISKSIEPDDLHDDLLQLTMDYKIEQALGKDYKEKHSSEDIDQVTTDILKASSIICCTCNVRINIKISNLKY